MSSDNLFVTNTKKKKTYQCQRFNILALILHEETYILHTQQKSENSKEISLLF